jgi:hypothetical protein
MIPIIGISVWIVVKAFALFALAIYIVFAFVIVKQVNLMTDTLEIGFEGPVRLLAWAHLLFSVGLFLLSFAIL